MTHILITVILAHFLALLSPGPDFLLVVRSGIRNSKLNALGVPLGIAIGNGIYIFLCLIGVGAILTTSIVVMSVMKFLGGLFLTYLAFMAIRAKKSDYTDLVKEGKKNAVGVKDSCFLRGFMTGFISAIMNPKNPIFYLSIFSVVLTDGIVLPVKIGLGVWMMSVVFIWDSLIVYVLSRDVVKRYFSKVIYYIDKFTGALLGVIGLSLIKSAFARSRL